MPSKYKLTDNIKDLGDKKLYQIQALKDFGGVKCGDLGGYIENEYNLSHFGNAWVSGNARVCNNVEVSGNARIYGDTWVSGNARIYGDAWVSGNAWVFGNAQVSDNAWVSKITHLLTCGPIGSRHGTVTFYRTKDNRVRVNCGCYDGSIDDFAARVDSVHKGTKHQTTYRKAIALARAQIDLEQQEGER